MKFDVVVMNPPYSFKEANNLDINIVNTLTDKICDKKIIIMPNKLYHKFKAVESFYNDHHLISQALYKTTDIFPEISTGWEYVSIYDVDYTKRSDTFIVKINDNNFEINGKLNERLETWNKIKYGINIVNLINKFSDLYNKLKKDFGTMCNDCENFIYEENKVGLYGIKKPEQKKLERVKAYLSNGTYKYCLYKGSGNHDYDEVQEYTGDISVFNGQICWLTNSLTVYNNMKYWMNCPLFDFWRRFYFKGSKYAACWSYTNIPALDFSLPENEFKSYVDSLNTFNENEFKVLKDFNVHNI